MEEKVKKTPKNRVNTAKFAGGGYWLTVSSKDKLASPDCLKIGCTWANGS